MTHYLVSHAFLAGFGAEHFPAAIGARLTVVDRAANALPSVTAGDEFALLDDLPLPAMLAAVESMTGRDGLCLLASAGANASLLAAELASLEDGQRAPDALLSHTCEISNFADKNSALTWFTNTLLEEGIGENYVGAIVSGVEESLLNAIYDAHPMLSKTERTSDYDLEVPVGLSWGVSDGVVTACVTDNFGSFKRSTFVDALVRAHLREPALDLTQHGLTIGLSMMVRSCHVLNVRATPGSATNVFMITDTKARFRDFVKGGRIIEFLEQKS